MNHNPLTEQCSALTRQIESLAKQVRRATDDLAWHASFNPKATARTIEGEAAVLAGLQADLLRIQTQVEQARRKTEELGKPTAFGWNPTYWFSAQRQEAKQKFETQQAVNRALEADMESIQHDIQTHQSRRTAADKALLRFRGIKPDKVTAAIDRMNTELTIGQLTLDDLDQRRRNVDQTLKAPLRQLADYQSEAATLDQAISEADDMDRRLTNAANGYERRLIHEECERRFGLSSPRGVASSRRRSLTAVHRNMSKVEARLKEIARRASLDIKALIIDGNNLCYQENQFIGLAALKPLCTRLSATHDITVVFDASIRRHTQLRDDDLRGLLPEATVHVVAPRRAADETILDAAQDAYVYVISNDRFGEFREKAAVREDRLLRHEIINGRVLVHDLWVDETFVAGT